MFQLCACHSDIPQYNSSETFRNVPLLLSHVCLCAVRFDGYLKRACVPAGTQALHIYGFTFFAVPEGSSRSCRSHIPKRWPPQARSRKAEKTSRQCHIGRLRRCFPFRWPPFRRISKRQKWEIICPWPNLLSFLNQFYHMAFSQSKRFGSKLTVYQEKPTGPLRCSEPAGYCSYSHSPSGNAL